MKVLRTSVPIFTSDIEAAIEQYEALTREAVLFVQDVEGVVFEFVELHSKE